MLYLTGERVIVSPQLCCLPRMIGKVNVYYKLAVPVAKGDLEVVIHPTTTNHKLLPTPD